ncbi:two-component sensor histidine kinase [Chloroflexus islandicus]|uniref:histidine kinase n=1 Tax=Chloroflexus islandicus TaxID=1707952 RepID=A0A178M290_9CHLR|nr:ATP-binding protein [Chloroflexus islandicus]OAN40546.1 two-component sensor histidine kinase [Chloroflexus islandicus]
MSRLRTLRVRFALWTAGLLLATMLGFSAFVYWRTAQGLRESLDAGLRASAAQVVTGIGGENVNIEDGQITLGDAVADPVALAQLQEQGLTIRVLRSDGTIVQAVGLYRDLPVDRASLQAAGGTPVFSTVPISGSGHVRVYTLPVQEHGQLAGLVQIMQSLEPVDETLQQLLIAFAFGIPVLSGLAGVGGYWLAARALQPIDAITRTAQQISAADLHARIELPPTADEVGRLAATFNNMLERLEDAFRRERQFTADASHELRTPVAAMEAILTVTRERARSGPEYEQALDDLLAQTRRLRSMIEDLLRLARGEVRCDTEREAVNLSFLLADVVETLQPLAEERALALHTDIAPNLTLIGDSDGLIRLFLNLIDNAIKYTPRGSITLRAARAGDQIEVMISDTGIGIDPAHLPHIFERFYRVDPSRSAGGAGLGLAIARQIVTAHAGTISVASQSGQGTTVTVRLPAV